MRVEVWSPDGMEAAGYGALQTVRTAENSEAVALLTSDLGARVWLEPEEAIWLIAQLRRWQVQRALAEQVPMPAD